MPLCLSPMGCDPPRLRCPQGEVQVLAGSPTNSPAEEQRLLAFSLCARRPIHRSFVNNTARSLTVKSSPKLLTALKTAKYALKATCGGGQGWSA